MEITLIGGMGLRVHDSEVAVGGPRAQAVLALLAVHAGQVVTVDWLIDQLWPAVPPRTARATVQSYASRLRSAAGSDGPRLLRGQFGGYVLDGDAVEIDTRRFGLLADRGREHLAAGRWPEAHSDLRAALGLWRGTPFAGIDDVPALVTERVRLEDLRAEVQLAEWQTVLELGQPASVVEPVRRLTEDRRWDERGWRLLVLALYRSGRQTEALQAVARARRLLVEEQGLDPSPELNALERAILTHDGALAPARHTPRIAHWLRPPSGLLVGRTDELADLVDAWTTTRATGSVRLVLVRGEPGVGKSSLVGALAQQVASGGGRVLCGRCLDAPRLPLQPWSELIDEPIDGADEAKGSTSALFSPWELAAHRIFRTVTGFIEEELRHGPTLVVAEDLHWAGPPALRLLEHVIRVCGDDPLLVVGTLRSTPGHTDRSTRAAMAELTARIRPRILDLEGLDASSIGELLAHHSRRVSAEEARAVHRRTGGVPLLALEAANGGSGLADARLAEVGPATAAVAELLAVAGDDLPVAVLSAASGYDEASLAAALDALADTGLVRFRNRSPVGVEFRHTLYREAVAERLSGLRRLVVARRLLHATDLLPDLQPPSAVARYALAAAESAVPADIVRAVEECRRAATRESAVHDHHAAAAWLRAARAQSTRLECPSGEVTVEYALACRRADRASAREAFLDAAEAARRQWRPDLLARIGIGWSRGFVEPPGAVDADLIGVLREALDAREQLAETDRARAMAALAAELTWAEDGDVRFGLADAALALARSTGDLGTIAYVLRAHHRTVAAADTVDIRRRVAEELLEVAARLDDPGLRAEALFHRCGPAIELGDVGLVDTLLAEAGRLADAWRQPDLQWSVGWSRASVLLWQGRLAEAETLAHESADLGLRAGRLEAPLFLATQLREIRRLQGRPAEVVGRPPIHPIPVGDGFGAARHLCTAGHTTLAASLAGRALVGGVLRLRRDRRERPSLEDLAYVAATLGITALGAAVYRALAPHAETFGHGVVAGPVGHHRLGVLAAAAGRSDRAIWHLRQAVVRHRTLGLPLLEAESSAELAGVQRRLGNASGAAAAEARARDLATAYDAPGVLCCLSGRAAAGRVGTRPPMSEPRPA